MKVRRTQPARGFTLIEMLVVVGIFGLILTAIGLEFSGVVSHTLHTRANTDAEGGARIMLTGVSDEMRAAFPDLTDFPLGPPPTVTQPAVNSTGPVAQFYRVHQGSLGDPIPACAAPNNLAPCPPFDVVTIQIDPLKPGVLEKLAQPVAGGGPSVRTVLGTNVTQFAVTSNGDGTRYSVDITVAAPSSHCRNNACTFTLDNVVYIGGLGTE
jgi:prepilin-type N-terminal cleavage/methylation domain-containing protein